MPATRARRLLGAAALALALAAPTAIATPASARPRQAASSNPSLLGTPTDATSTALIGTQAAGGSSYQDQVRAAQNASTGLATSVDFP